MFLDFFVKQYFLLFDLLGGMVCQGNHGRYKHNFCLNLHCNVLFFISSIYMFSYSYFIIYFLMTGNRILIFFNFIQLI